MTFTEFCAFNGIEAPKTFEMLDNCLFPQEAFTIDFTIVMFSTRGQATIRIDGKDRYIGRRYMSVFRSGMTLECLSISEEFSVKVLLIGGNLDKILSVSDVFLTMFVLDESPVIRVTSAYTASARLFFDALARVVKFQDNPYQEECLLSLMRAFFYSTGYYLHEAFDFTSKGKELQGIVKRLKAYDEDSPVRRFITLVETNVKTKRSLSFYADQLGYHPKYLSTLVKRQTGLTGQTIIDQYAILVIIAKLSFSDKSIKEISNELDYPSQSDFGKFFKRMTGVSPLQYRKQI